MARSGKPGKQRRFFSRRRDEANLDLDFVSDAPLRKRRKIVGKISLAWMLPNLLTIAALLAGLTAIRFAFLENWDGAVLMVLLAGILDALDGRMARLLKTSSEFGAHLDSLSDMVVFGVVPSVILYLWILEDGGRLAWAGCMYFTACCGLRLARFNSELHDKPAWAVNYFTGIPTPAAGFLALTPMVASFNFDWWFLQSWPVVTLWLTVVATGAISTIPSFSGKALNIPRTWALPMLGIFALLVAGFVSRPWQAWVYFSAAYIALLPVSGLGYYRRKQTALGLRGKKRRK